MIDIGKIARVHIDTEFTEFVHPELISIGLSINDAHEFYGENLSFNRKNSSDFVQKVVYPLLKPDQFGMKETELSARLWTWFDELPFEFVVISADYQTDFDLLLNLLGEKHPKMLVIENQWLTISKWIYGTTFNDPNPDEACRVIHTTIRQKFSDHVMNYFLKTKEIPHHALSDARSNRVAWDALKQDFAIPN